MSTKNGTKVTSCTLEPEEGSSYQTVALKHLEEISIGRTPDTSVDDVRVSRKQVVFSADFFRKEVSVKRVGRNPSFLDGLCMKLHQSYKAQHHSLVELVENGCKYRVKFHEAAVNGSNKKSPRKPDRSVSPRPAKKMKEDESPVADFNDDNVVWIDTRNTVLACKYGTVDDKIGRVKNKNEAFRIAAFDMDGTIIKTKSGHVHPRGPTDWMLWNPMVPSALKKLESDGFFIVFISNQASLNYQANVGPFKSKVEDIVRTLAVPMIVMISTADDFYRKPSPGMWFYLRDTLLGGRINMDKSYYVGDAAGRVAGWKPGQSKDFSISDRLFARNVDLKFVTPEEFFLKEKPGRYCEPAFVPSEYKYSEDVASMFVNCPPDKPEVILMVGLPASGKSTFAKKFLVPKGYVYVNRDTLGTAAKCEKLLKDSLSSRKKVVVDNTNVDVESRKKLIAICEQFKVPVRCFVMDSSFQRCQHNNKFRIITKSDHAFISPMVMRSSISKYVPPKLDEGFTEIIRIPFIPSFKCEEDQNLYNYHLLVPKDK